MQKCLLDHPLEHNEKTFQLDKWNVKIKTTSNLKQIFEAQTIGTVTTYEFYSKLES